MDTMEHVDSAEECIKIQPAEADDKNSKGITRISEGSCEIIGEGHVFYNPVQEFNRDLSVLVLSTFSLLRQRDEQTQVPITEPGQKDENGMTILEALSATGLRSIRYAKEIPGVKQIYANDISIQAVEAIKENVKRNKVEHMVSCSHDDAIILMHKMSRSEKFDIVDIDPYGCPTRFLDGAVQTVADGGLLLVTATDMGMLCGNTPESCYVKYGSIPLKSKACHELALRILLRHVEVQATKYGRYTVPILSISADFYIRVFIQIFTSPVKCKLSSSKQSMVYQCTGCTSLTLQPLGILKPNPTEKNPNQMKFCIPVGPAVNSKCEHCNQGFHTGGPIWSAPIHDMSFVDKLIENLNTERYQKLGTYTRLLGVLSVVREELVDVPLYYSIGTLCSTLKLEVIPMLKFRSALLFAGYEVSYSHACKSSIKTNAPNRVIWDILRCWAKIHPVNEKRIIDGTPLKKILSVGCDVSYELNETHPEANPYSRRNLLTRFQINPTAHWGPGTRATIMTANTNTKSIKNQNKNTKKRIEKCTENSRNLKQQKVE